MLRTGKAPQIAPKLLDQDLGGAPTDPQQRIEQFERRCVLLEALLDFCAHALHGLLQIIQMAQLPGEHEGVMGREVADDSLLQQCPLRAQPTTGEFCEGGGIGFAGQEGCEDGAGGDPSDIGDDGGQLDIGIFEHGFAGD